MTEQIRGDLSEVSHAQRIYAALPSSFLRGMVGDPKNIHVSAGGVRISTDLFGAKILDNGKRPLLEAAVEQALGRRVPVEITYSQIPQQTEQVVQQPHVLQPPKLYVTHPYQGQEDLPLVIYSGNQDASDALLQFVQSAEKGEIQQAPLLIIGPNGAGKTRLISRTIEQLAGKGILPAYCDLNQLSSEAHLRAGKTTPDLSYLRRAKAVLLDAVETLNQGHHRKYCEEAARAEIDSAKLRRAPVAMSFTGTLDDLEAFLDRLRKPDQWSKPANPDLADRILESERVRIYHPNEDKSRFLVGLLQQYEVAQADRVAEIMMQRTLGGSIRAIVGDIRTLQGYARRRGTGITPELALEVLGERNLVSEAPTPQRLLEAISKYTLVPVAEIIGPGRSRSVIPARNIAAYMLSTEFGLSLAEIGKILGNRNHSTIPASKRKIASKPEADIKRIVDGVRSKMQIR